MTTIQMKTRRQKKTETDVTKEINATWEFASRNKLAIENTGITINSIQTDVSKHSDEIISLQNFMEECRIEMGKKFDEKLTVFTKALEKSIEKEIKDIKLSTIHTKIEDNRKNIEDKLNSISEGKS